MNTGGVTSGNELGIEKSRGYGRRAIVVLPWKQHDPGCEDDVEFSGSMGSVAEIMPRKTDSGRSQLTLISSSTVTGGRLWCVTRAVSRS